MPRLGSLRSEMYLIKVRDKYNNERDPIKKAQYGEHLRLYKKKLAKKRLDED